MIAAEREIFKYFEEATMELSNIQKIWEKDNREGENFMMKHSMKKSA